MRVILAGNIIQNMLIQVIQFFYDLIVGLLDAITFDFLNIFGLDTKTMEQWFPFIPTAEKVFLAMGLGLAFLLLIWTLFTNMFGFVTEEYENSLRVFGRFAIAMICIYNTASFTEYLFGIMSGAFDTMMNIESNTALTSQNVWSGLGDVMLTSFNKTLAEPSTGNVIGAVTAPIRDKAYSVIFIVLSLLFIVAIAWQYLKLVLEITERYVVLCLLKFTTPLGLAMITTKSTSNIFKNWLQMWISQLILMVMNIFFLRAANSGIAMAMTGLSAQNVTSAIAVVQASDGHIFSGNYSNSDMLFWCFLMIAFLQAGTQIDRWLQSLGLSVAQCGGGLANSVTAAFCSLSTISKAGSSVGKAMGIGGTSGKGNMAFGGTGGGLLGAKMSAKEKLSNVMNGTMSARSGKDLSDAVSSVMFPNGLPTGSKAIPIMSSAARGTFGMGIRNADGSISMLTATDKKPKGPHSTIMGPNGKPMYTQVSGAPIGGFTKKPMDVGDKCNLPDLTKAGGGCMDAAKLKQATGLDLDMSNTDRYTATKMDDGVFQIRDTYMDASNGGNVIGTLGCTNENMADYMAKGATFNDDGSSFNFITRADSPSQDLDIDEIMGVDPSIGEFAYVEAGEDGHWKVSAGDKEYELYDASQYIAPDNGEYELVHGDGGTAYYVDKGRSQISLDENKSTILEPVYKREKVYDFGSYARKYGEEKNA